jgi:putative (di)nucleoside polyphosphate hydrolase
MAEYISIDGAVYRKNAGIVVFRMDGKVLLCERVLERCDDKSYLWQFPQGGIEEGEEPKAAALRELFEETGITSTGRILEYPGWLRYEFPSPLVRRGAFPDADSKDGNVMGQVQKWFLMEFTGKDSELHFPSEEFASCKWVPLSTGIADSVISFRREVYRKIIPFFIEKLNGK